MQRQQRNIQQGVMPARGGGGTSYDGLYGEAPSVERGTLFRLQVFERVGILLDEVYERERKSVIWVCEKAQRAEQKFAL